MTTNTLDECLTVDGPGAAKLCGVSLASWHRALSAGKAPTGIKIGGRRVWLRNEITAWLTAGAPPAAKWKFRS